MRRAYEDNEFFEERRRGSSLVTEVVVSAQVKILILRFLSIKLGFIY